jgi:AhpD family alkylhydroperoxidase
MASIATSAAAASAPGSNLRPGDRINRDVGAILARRPEAAKAFLALQSALRTSGTLSPRLVELIRLRIAFHNQCRSCMAIRYRSAIDDGVTEDTVCATMVGFGRMVATWDVADDLPDGLQCGTGAFAPWRSKSVVASG